jgi:hypothetical protein
MTIFTLRHAHESGHPGFKSPLSIAWIPAFQRVKKLVAASNLGPHASTGSA